MRVVLGREELCILFARAGDDLGGGQTDNARNRFARLHGLGLVVSLGDANSFFHSSDLSFLPQPS
jgi:hypothetical protein